MNAIYMHHYALSVRRELDDAIEAVLRGELGGVVQANPRLDMERLVAVLKEVVKVKKWEVELPNGSPVGERAYRCAGYRVSVIPAHVELHLDLWNEQTAAVADRIAERLSGIDVPCPRITYASGKTHLGCETAGSCTELARLALEIDKLLSQPRVEQTNGRPSFMYDNGQLSVSNLGSANARDELEAFARLIERKELVHGLLEYVRAGGTR